MALLVIMGFHEIGTPSISYFGIEIRNVNPDPSRIDALDRLIDEVSATGTQLVLSPDSVFAASHAAAEGLIAVDRLPEIRSDKREDDSAPPAKTGL
jgi:hypothetical protein